MMIGIMVSLIDIDLIKNKSCDLVTEFYTDFMGSGQLGSHVVFAYFSQRLSISLATQESTIPLTICMLYTPMGNIVFKYTR